MAVEFPLYDKGGLLMPHGTQIVQNKTGKPELIITRDRLLDP